MAFSCYITSSAILSDLGAILGSFLPLNRPLEVTTELSQGRDQPYLKDIDKQLLFGKFQKNPRQGFLTICINMLFLAYFGYFAPFWTVPGVTTELSQGNDQLNLIDINRIQLFRKFKKILRCHFPEIYHQVPLLVIWGLFWGVF